MTMADEPTPLPTVEDDKMRELLIESLKDERFDHFSIIWRSDKDGFNGDREMTPEICLLIQNHSHRITRWVSDGIVTLHWNDGGREVLATVIPGKCFPHEKFKKFMLPFPKNVAPIRR
jgi:hypothetical protein